MNEPYLFQESRHLRLEAHQLRAEFQAAVARLQRERERIQRDHDWRPAADRQEAPRPAPEAP